jgi:WhiB family redox-sensing transcriptional regulator
MTDLRPVCEDYDGRVFYPARGDRGANAYAKSLCNTCPLIDPCLAGAMERKEQGIWGGTTERERARMRRAAS